MFFGDQREAFLAFLRNLTPQIFDIFGQHHHWRRKQQRLRRKSRVERCHV